MPSASKLPLISVCIANYNGESYLVECIGSVLAQQGPFDLEVLVHDDASTDASRAVLACYETIQVIQSETNVGFCLANNRMADAAKGEYILLLNNDAALLPGALAALLDAALRPGSRILSLTQYDWESDAIVDRGCRLDIFHVPVPYLAQQGGRVAYVIGACLWIEREAWSKIGGFPVWMGSVGEDLYLCALARLLGMDVEVTPTSGYRHRQGASFGGNRAGPEGGLSTNYRRRRLSERNRAAVLAVCTPTLAWIPWMALHIAALALEGVVLSIAKRSSRPLRDIYVAAIQWLWHQRKLLLETRKLVQEKRRISLSTYLRNAYTWRIRKWDMLLKYGLPKLR